MSTKYTPLDNTEGSPHSQGTTPPSYELDDFAVRNSEPLVVQSSIEPLDVIFHGDSGIKNFELNYNPQRGISGIHKTIGNKLNSLGIQVDHELYLIGVWNFKKDMFRLLTCDEDRINQKFTNTPVYYFRTDEENSITDAYNRKTRKVHIILLSVLVTFIISVILLIWIAS